MNDYDIRCICGHKPHESLGPCPERACRCPRFVRTDVAIAQGVHGIANGLSALVQILDTLGGAWLKLHSIELPPPAETHAEEVTHDSEPNGQESVPVDNVSRIIRP